MCTCAFLNLNYSKYLECIIKKLVSQKQKERFIQQIFEICHYTVLLLLADLSSNSKSLKKWLLAEFSFLTCVYYSVLICSAVYQVFLWKIKVTILDYKIYCDYKTPVTVEKHL